MNPIFQAFNNNNQNLGMLGNFQNLMQRFNQFKSTFQGNPKQQVQQLLNSGQMSQSQFNQLQNLASQMQKLMKGG